MIITTTDEIFKSEKYTETIDYHSFDNENIIILVKEYNEKNLCMHIWWIKKNWDLADIIFIETDPTVFSSKYINDILSKKNDRIDVKIIKNINVCFFTS